jgi:hypothetical protein
MKKKSILKMLQGGDRRSIGRANRVATIVKEDAGLFSELLGGLWSEDALVRMRAADATEKVTRKRPELLAAYKKELLGLLAETERQEMRWHLAAIVPRLKLNARERDRAMAALKEYLKDRSSIVKTFALQGMADFAEQDAALRAGVVELLREATRSGTAAMKARGRKLLKKLES